MAIDIKVPLGNCQFRQAGQICQAPSRDARLKCGKPHLNAVPILGTFNGWKMTDLLGWRVFFPGVLLVEDSNWVGYYIHHVTSL